MEVFQTSQDCKCPLASCIVVRQTEHFIKSPPPHSPNSIGTERFLDAIRSHKIPQHSSHKHSGSIEVLLIH